MEKFNQHTYKAITDARILPFMRNVHGALTSFIVQEDNCAPHRAKSVATCLANNVKSRIKWSAQSPDLNPIEKYEAL